MKQCLALLLCAPALALAQESPLSYDFFEVDYSSSTWSLDPVDYDSNGLGFGFSIDFRNEFFMFGDYHHAEFDVTDDPATSLRRLGLGKAFDVGPRTSVYAAVGAARLDLDLGLGSVNDDGPMVGAGARIAFGDSYELRFGVQYLDVSGAGIDGAFGKATATVGADLHLTDVVALTLGFSENEESISTFSVGLRFYPTRDDGDLRRRSH